MISGINGALMAYINTHSILDIRKDLECFNETQNKNLLQLLKLIKKSGLMSIFWTQKVKLFYAALLANNSH